MSALTPTCRDLLDVSAAPGDQPWDALAARVEAVLAMHHPSHDRDGKPVGVCADCGWAVPCPTLRALDGGKP